MLIQRIEGAFNYDVFAGPNGDRVVQINDGPHVIQIVFDHRTVEEYLIPTLHTPKIASGQPGMILPI